MQSLVAPVHHGRPESSVPAVGAAFAVGAVYEHGTPEYASLSDVQQYKWECVRGIDGNFGYNGSSRPEGFDKDLPRPLILLFERDHWYQWHMALACHNDVLCLLDQHELEELHVQHILLRDVGQHFEHVQ